MTGDRGIEHVDAALPARGRRATTPRATGAPGDLWEDFAARAHAQPGKVALVLDDRARHLRRAAPRGRRAVRPPRRRRLVQPGDVVILLGRHSIEAAVALLGVPAPRRRARAAAADVQRHPARRRSHARPARGRSSASAARRRSRSASDVAHGSTALIALAPGDARRADRRGRAGRPRGPPTPTTSRMVHALLRHDLGAEGHRALEQHAALRDRGHLPALAALRATTLPRRVASSASSAASSSATCPCCSTAAPACS